MFAQLVKGWTTDHSFAGVARPAWGDREDHLVRIGTGHAEIGGGDVVAVTQLEELEETDLHHGHEGIAIAIAQSDAIDPPEFEHAIDVRSQGCSTGEFHEHARHEGRLATEAVTITTAQHDVACQPGIHADVLQLVGKKRMHGQSRPGRFAVAPDPRCQLRINKYGRLRVRDGIIVLVQRDVAHCQLHLPRTGKEARGHVEVARHLHVVSIGQQETGVAVIACIISLDEGAEAMFVGHERLALGAKHTMQTDPTGGRRPGIADPLLAIAQPQIKTILASCYSRIDAELVEDVLGVLRQLLSGGGPYRNERKEDGERVPHRTIVTKPV